MITWLKRRKLVALVERLALYNDKGIEWSKHEPARVEYERAKLIAEIEEQIASMGREQICPQLLEAIEDKSIATDITGKYVQYAKQGNLY